MRLFSTSSGSASEPRLIDGPSAATLRGQMDDRLAVLMMHDVGEAHPGSGYTVSRLRLGEILRAAGRPGGAVPFQFTFDDGHLGTFERGLPELRAAGVAATLFVTTDFIGRPAFMDRARLRSWVDAGQLLGSHAVTHRPLSLLAEAEAVSELRDSRSRLEDWSGGPVLDFAFPGGNDTPRLRQIALEAGYRHVFTSEPGFARVSDPIRPRFTVRASTPVAAVARLAEARLSTPFLLDALRFRVKRLVGAAAYRRLRRELGGAAGGPST